MPKSLKDKIKLLSFPQVLLLILLFVGGIIATWFIAKNISTTIYSDRIQEVEAETKNFTSDLKQRLTRVEDTLFNTQSFFRASDNVTQEEFSTFIENSHIAKNFSSIDSVFFINKKNKQLNTTTEKFFHDIEKGSKINIIYKTSSISPEDISDINRSGNDILSKSEFTDNIFGLTINRSQKNKHIHFILPVHVSNSNEVMGIVGTSFSLSQYQKSSSHENFAYNLEVNSNDNNAIFISEGDMGPDSATLSFLPGFNDLSIFNDQQSFSFAGLTWNLSYHANLAKDAPLWLESAPYAILLSGLITTALILSILFMIMTDRERVRKEIKKKTEELKREEFKFEAIFNNTFQFIGLLDTDGTVIDTNDTSLRAAGIDRKTVLGKKFWDTFWFQNSDETKRQIRKAVKQASSGQLFREDLKAQNADGEMWVDFSIKPVHNKDGKIEFLIPEGRNISDRKRVERELGIKEKALASINEGITISDPNLDDNPLVYTNKAFESLTGYSGDEVRGKNCRFLQGKKTDEEKVEKMRSSIEKEENCEVVIRNYKKDGEVFWNNLSISPVYQEGELVRFIGVQKDITEVKNMKKN